MVSDILPLVASGESVCYGNCHGGGLRVVKPLLVDGVGSVSFAGRSGLWGSEKAIVAMWTGRSASVSVRRISVLVAFRAVAKYSNPDLGYWKQGRLGSLMSVIMLCGALP